MLHRPSSEIAEHVAIFPARDVSIRPFVSPNPASAGDIQLIDFLGTAGS